MLPGDLDPSFIVGTTSNFGWLDISSAIKLRLLLNYNACSVSLAL